MELKDLDLSIDERPKHRVIVESIYEPSQTNTINSGNSFELLETDLNEINADKIAKSLGLQRVGFIFSHQPRPNCGYEFTAHELIQSGLQCLDASEGKRDSPFIIVKVSCDEKGLATMEAFQLSSQCLDMIAEDALIPMKDSPGVSAIHSTFTAIVEAKAAEVVDNDMFIMRVPILSHTSLLSNNFPKYNRDDEQPSIYALGKILKPYIKNSSDGLIKRLADFQLLLFLCECLEVETACEIASIVSLNIYPVIKDSTKKDVIEPISEGYLFMIASLFEES